MMYETAEMKVDEEVTCVKEEKTLASTMEDTVDALTEIHCQLSGLSEFLFGDERESFERPITKCFQDSVMQTSGMAKYALERLMRIKERLGA